MNNIFDFATTELSQDALLCYWFNFASETYFYESEAERITAQKLLSLIIARSTDKEIAYDKIKVSRIFKQYHHIDVLLLVNHEYLIIIEDKLYTKEHSNQLERYNNLLSESKDPTLRDKKRIPVYFKMIDQSSYDSNQYVSINRKDVLDILESHTFATSSILNMFKEHIGKIENEAKNFASVPYEKWNYNHFTGFYFELGRLLKTSDFEYDMINNKNGGFIGFWWYFLDDYTLNQRGIRSTAIKALYLQIEKITNGSFQLAVKISFDKTEASKNEYLFRHDIDNLDNYFSTFDNYNKRHRRLNLDKNPAKHSNIVARTLVKTPLGSLNNIEEVGTICIEGQEILEALDIKN